MTQHELWCQMMQDNATQALATLVHDITFYHFDQDTRIQTPYMVPTGTRVRVLVASRLGDLCISTDLEASYGYDCRFSVFDEVGPDPDQKISDIELITVKRS